VISSVCLSMRQDISGTTRAIFTIFSVHVGYGRGSVLLRQSDEIQWERGNFGGFLPHLKCTVTRSLQITSCSSRTDHSVAVGAGGDGNAVHSADEV